MDLNYFTCTLGEAALHHKVDHSIANVNLFIDQLVQHCGDKPAAGFYIPPLSKEEAWKTQILNFTQVQRGSLTVANTLSRANRQGLSSSRVVALLAPSTPEFLFTWLALMRLGHGVLLIAPQCQPPAIAHLCKQCDVTCMLYDKQHLTLARGAGNLMSEENAREFWIFDINSVMGDNVFETIRSGPTGDLKVPDGRPDDVAYLFHTSGTSTGLPKQIPQSHRAAVSVLPRLDGSREATFTTTPLYHGGIADLFRAWSSNAMIWLFPGRGIPITATNILHCLRASQRESRKDRSPPIKYFSSVPYVLQMMEQEQEALSFLRKMDIVGVGGAALPEEVGHRLVKQGVNLVSRFGSAECGFLLSSHRDYEHDKDWQFLRDYTTTPSRSTARGGLDSGNYDTDHHLNNITRNGNGIQNDAAISAASPELLRFESSPDGLYELVVGRTWPHLAKTNRSDGSYATSDLFEAHPDVPRAWRYHSRADAQLTLMTGKKFDPAPLESAIAASSPLVSEVLIFGDGQSHPGALLFRSEEAKGMSDEALMDVLWPKIEHLNMDNQSHARISFPMVRPMPWKEADLPKSSKGTLIRGKAAEKFAQTIKDSYSLVLGQTEAVEDPDLDEHILSVVQRVRGSPHSSLEKLDIYTDLFAYGLDSVACIQLRKSIQSLVPKDRSELPFSVVEDCGNVKRLSEFVLRRRHGEADVVENDDRRYMLELVENYSSFSSPIECIQSSDAPSREGKIVVALTGATGALGAHVLHQYRQNPSVSKIYCFVRGADSHAAKERVSKALSYRGFPDLTSPEMDQGKVEVLQCQLSDSFLGLAPSTYQRVVSEVTTIVHLAWAVNFRLNLRSFEKEHIAGTTHLINFAMSSPKTPSPTFIFCSSTASCTGLSTQITPAGSTDASCSGTPSTSLHMSHVPERILHDPSTASALGYGRSKWVSEQCLAQASKTSTKLQGRIAIVRVGQLSGDTKSGIWNMQEAWPTMLKSIEVTNALPALKTQVLDWLPIDIAAKAIVETEEAMSGHGLEGESVKVFHVLNTNTRPTWMEMLEWVKEQQKLDILEPAEWLARLEEVSRRRPEHPASKLLGLWRDAYGSGSTDSAEPLCFDTKDSVKVIPTMRQVNAVSKEYFYRLSSWLQHQES